MPAVIGQRIGSYEIIALLGRGGMAEVYHARQTLAGGVQRDVALKLIDARLSSMPEFSARFNREAQTLISLSHPHILKAFDYGLYDGSAYLVMEMMTGGSLAELIRQGPLPYRQVVQFVEQIGGALDYAHREGIVHRDLKPQNVLLDKSGNAFLTDFGIVKLLDGSTNLTQSQSVIGTPSYMSPEQGTANMVDARSDLYSLGVVVFELLSGRVPFQADTPVQVLFKHAYETSPRLTTVRPDAPAAIDDVLAKALAKSPDDRYQSAAALVADLNAALNHQPVSAPALPVLSVSKSNTVLLRANPVAPNVATSSGTSMVTPAASRWPTALRAANGGGRRRAGLGALTAVAAVAVIMVASGIVILGTLRSSSAPTLAPTATIRPAVEDTPTSATIPASTTALFTATFTASVTVSLTPSLTNTLLQTKPPPTTGVPATALSIQALAGTIKAQAQTATATFWTAVPAPTVTPTINITASLSAFLTQDALANDLTATATGWTATPTVTLTHTATTTGIPSWTSLPDTATSSATFSLTPRPAATVKVNIITPGASSSGFNCLTMADGSTTAITANDVQTIIPALDGVVLEVTRAGNLLNARALPISNGRIIRSLGWGDRVLWKNQHAAGYLEVYLGDNTTAYISDDPTFTTQVDPAQITTGIFLQSTLLVNDSGAGSHLRLNTSTQSKEIHALQSHETLTVVGGPCYSEYYIWWQLKTSGGATGWHVDMPIWWQPMGAG